MIDALSKNVCEVTFKKSNGEVRNMTCTRLPDLITVNEEIFEDANDTKIVVLDTAEFQIRSFRPSTVTGFQIIAQD